MTMLMPARFMKSLSELGKTACSHLIQNKASHSNALLRFYVFTGKRFARNTGQTKTVRIPDRQIRDVKMSHLRIGE